MGLQPYDYALMKNDPLPTKIDVRKLAVKDAEINSNFAPGIMPRLMSLLTNDEGLITANLHFYIDTERKRRVDGKVNAKVNMVCQRCLDPVTVEVVSEFALAIIWTDEQAKQLPESLEPLIVGEEPKNLTDIVEEELILTLPIVSYHDEDNCKQVLHSFGEANIPAFQEELKENLFNVWETLKSDK